MLEEVDREAFNFMFGKELTYTTVRSDQRVVELIPKGSSTVVRFEDRKEFIRLVQKARLEESKEQVMPRSRPCKGRDRLSGPPGTLCLAWLFTVGWGPAAVTWLSSGGSYSCRAAPCGAPGCAGPAHLAAAGEEGLWEP